MEEKKTHRLIEKPTMSVRFLADYMAASDQARRTILRGCKFRTIARLVQHDDAKLAVAKFMLGGTNDPEVLVAEADYIRNKLADSDFDRDCNDINADYVAQFAKVVADIEPLPAGAEWRPVKPPFASQSVNGVRVTFGPALLTRRGRRLARRAWPRGRKGCWGDPSSYPMTYHRRCDYACLGLGVLAT